MIKAQYKLGSYHLKILETKLMQQYLYEDIYKGQPRKLLILMPQEGTDYRVFCESNFLGSVRLITGDNGIAVWKTDYNILKPIALKIGQSIELQQNV